MIHPRFYKYLIPTDEHNKTKRNGQRGLLDDYDESILKTKFVIQSTSSSGEIAYCCFNDHIEFAKYQQRIEPSKRSFYEIIPNSYQKPYFDVDISTESFDNFINTSSYDNIHEVDDIKDILIDAIKEVFDKYQVSLSLEHDVLVYSSHGNKKWSFHIVINNYCHSDKDQSKSFVEQVYSIITNQIPDIPNEWIDRCVYKRNQQLRILGSQKPKSNRPKRFQEYWSYHGQIIQHEYKEEPTNPFHLDLMKLESSLVSFTYTCRHLPKFKTETLNNRHIDHGDLTPDQVKQIMDLYNMWINTNQYHEYMPFKLYSVTHTIINLKRTRPSYCVICNRKHHSDNAYLIVIGYNDVHYICRRNNNKKLHIGKLNSNSLQEYITEKNNRSGKSVVDGLTIKHHDDNYHNSIINRYKSNIESNNPNTSTYMELKKDDMSPIDRLNKFKKSTVGLKTSRKKVSPTDEDIGQCSARLIKDAVNNIISDG